MPRKKAETPKSEVKVIGEFEPFHKRALEVIKGALENNGSFGGNPILHGIVQLLASGTVIPSESICELRVAIAKLGAEVEHTLEAHGTLWLAMVKLNEQEAAQKAK